jgi:hypothetical protein
MSTNWNERRRRKGESNPSPCKGPRTVIRRACHLATFLRAFGSIARSDVVVYRLLVEYVSHHPVRTWVHF